MTISLMDLYQMIQGFLFDRSKKNKKNFLIELKIDQLKCSWIVSTHRWIEIIFVFIRILLLLLLFVNKTFSMNLSNRIVFYFNIFYSLQHPFSISYKFLSTISTYIHVNIRIIPGLVFVSFLIVANQIVSLKTKNK